MKLVFSIIICILVLNSCCKEEELLFKNRIQFYNLGFIELKCYPAQFTYLIFDSSTKETFLPITYYDTFNTYTLSNLATYSINYRIKDKIKCKDMLLIEKEYNVIEIVSAKRN